MRKIQGSNDHIGDVEPERNHANLIRIIKYGYYTKTTSIGRKMIYPRPLRGHLKRLHRPHLFWPPSEFPVRQSGIVDMCPQPPKKETLTSTKRLVTISLLPIGHLSKRLHAVTG
jgi:hypothetical protein